ncbi:hypothetical protein [Mycolicibacterium confluentis]|uniref:Uncharacterized protein n=1 Tax=Mycolicibacterium confluentis TaxID=28047 RepID=A0A7I7Y2E9_9MYCO|nr:hypothetical protein [Mycolicibacterium confluentis]MCV7322847.1 hypothetical protein [Mycolicibacterium confluentis]ORV20619.1 hypothetical protein AWB99_06555 [Mycolicibacterium confluentis]BBZ35845.1 hypothetical protein MCNF_44500 [Mycolicibacterium confluentis]
MTRRSAAVPAYALVLALVVTAPLLGPGYLLLRDAVSTPRSHLTDTALGLSQAAPRALPQDFLMALVSQVVDGGILLKALLIAGLWAAGWGAARLADTVLPDVGLPGQFVAATVAIWNPYVAERLLQGHWSLLVGYGCLPWVAVAMLRLRAGQTGWSGRAGWAALAFWIALAGLTPTGLLLALVVALVCVSAPGTGASRIRCAAGAVSLAVLCALPWLVAAAVSDSLSGYDASGAGTAAFAARAEPGLGTLGSLAGLAGIWNAQAVPGSRTTLFALAATAVLVVIVAVGVPAVLRRRSAVGLLVLAAAAVLLPAVLATGVGVAAVEAASSVLPGLGVLRDGQKWVALAMPGYAVAAAGAVVTLSRWRIGARQVVTATALCAALIAVLPDLAWGVWGSVRPVQYPPGWAAVAERIDADPHVVAVLPADAMRRFDWAGPAPVLDPLPRWLDADVLATGDLAISGQTVRGEGGDARAVQDLLLAGGDPARLADLGVGWVVVEADSEGEMGSAATTLDRLPLEYADEHMRLYRIEGTPAPQTNPRRGLLIAAHAVWLAVLLAGFVGQISVGQTRSVRPGR